jgi:SecD/SecF fusion protein
MGKRRRNFFVLLLVLALCAASAIVIVTQPTVLGLDLKGGTELVYQARATPQTPTVDAGAIDRSIEIIRRRTDTLGVSEPEISRLGSTGIIVGLPNVQNAQQAIQQIGKTSQLHLYDFEANVIPNPQTKGAPKNPKQPPQPVPPSIYSFPDLYSAVKFASQRKPSCPANECTTKGPTYYLFERGGNHRLRAGPAQQKSDLFLLFKNERRPPGTQVLSVPQGTVVVADPRHPSLDSSVAQLANGPQFVLRDRAALSGSDITDPKQSFDSITNQPNVTFGFTGSGKSAFEKVTSQIAFRGQATAPPGISSAEADQFSQHFAIILDNQVFSSPIINFIDNPGGINGSTGAQISGNFTIDTAQNLAQVLQIGALPVNLQLISQSTVSATLGSQALHQGLVAGIVGLAAIVLFLIAYYRLLGLVAVLGLVIYALFFYALIKLIPITLTLPGIAGLILTIGVAADANIVIFERIKEEARAGRSMLSAISQGYKRGIATIIDANVITLFTAFILFVLATAGVKGFAFTLGVGTIVSLFTAVLFTQAFLGTFARAKILRSPSALGARKRHFEWNFDFTGASKWFFSISGTILAIGAISLATKQLNLGIDFTSGARVQASLAQPATVDQVRSALSDAGVSGTSQAEIQSITNSQLGPHSFQIEGKFSSGAVNNQIKNALDQKFGLRGGSQGYNGEVVGPTFGADVARSAVIAIVFSLLVISAYVAIRFELKYAVPVLIALAHDLLITAGVYSLTGREVTSGTVAALLTILGYSMYDTIIVFDRIRENVPRMPRAAFSQIVNRSMSQVLTRSLITGLSTVFLVTVLFIFGGTTLKDFAFAMMVGVLSGAYSSIFIASPVLTHWKEREPAYRSRRARIAEAMGFVPKFPEENVVARVEEVERAGEAEPVAAVGRQSAVRSPQKPAEEAVPEKPRPTAPAAVETEAPETDGDGAAPAPAEPDVVGARSPAPERPAKAARQQRRRQQRRRRKHGRNR